MSGYSSKQKGSSSQVDYAGGSSKRPSSKHTQSNSNMMDQIGPNGERKQHSTKIANALKKYINEIETTTNQISATTGSKAQLYDGSSRTGKDSHRGKSHSHAQRRTSAGAKSSKEPSS